VLENLVNEKVMGEKAPGLQQLLDPRRGLHTARHCYVKSWMKRGGALNKCGLAGGIQWGAPGNRSSKRGGKVPKRGQ